jgi:hypothetical protein
MDMVNVVLKGKIAYVQIAMLAPLNTGSVELRSLFRPKSFTIPHELANRPSDIKTNKTTFSRKGRLIFRINASGKIAHATSVAMKAASELFSLQLPKYVRSE